MRVSSIVPSRMVSDDEPILRTVLADAAMSGRAAASGTGPGRGFGHGRRLRSSFQAPVGASRAGCVAAARREVRVPVEDDRVVFIADQHGVAGAGARLGEGLLDAEAGEPVGQVADRLVVGEVRLR